MKDELLSKIKIELEKSIEINERLVKYTKEYLDIPSNDFEDYLFRFKIDESKMHGRLKDVYDRFALERRLPNTNFEDIYNMVEEYLIRLGMAKQYNMKVPWANRRGGYHNRTVFIPTDNGKKYMGVKNPEEEVLYTYFYALEFEELINKVFPKILPRY